MSDTVISDLRDIVDFHENTITVLREQIKRLEEDRAVAENQAYDYRQEILCLQDHITNLERAL